MGRDGGDKKEVKGWKGRGKDLPDQCQTASYAPERQPQSVTQENRIIGQSWFLSTTQFLTDKIPQVHIHITTVNTSACYLQQTRHI